MQLNGYCVAIVSDSGLAQSFYDGSAYQKEPEKMKIFSYGEVQAARKEQGNQQRFTLEEVRVIPVTINIPIEIEGGSPVPESLPPVPAGKLI